MPGELVPIVLGSVFLISVAYVIKVVSDNRTRRTLIQQQASSDVIEKLFLEHRPADYESALRQGLLAFGLGLAFAVIAAGQLGPSDAMSYGLLLMFGAGGSLLYYWMKKPKE